MLKKLAQLLENAWVHLMSGVILLLTAGLETIRTLEDEALGAHHGVTVFAVIQVLRYLPDVVHGAEQLNRVGKR